MFTSHGEENISSLLFTEWLQCRDEGRDVSVYDARVRSAVEAAEPCRMEIGSLFEALASAPARPDFPYKEPSELIKIQMSRPPRRHMLEPGYQPETCRDQLRGAWIGMLAGCRLARQMDGISLDRLVEELSSDDDGPPAIYFDGAWENGCGHSPTIHHSASMILPLSLLGKHELSFTGSDILRYWHENLPYLSLTYADRAAYRNGVSGLPPPETATYRNPFRECSSAMRRGFLWGLILHGAPERSAALAWRDASVSHTKNGVYGEMLLSAFLSSAAATANLQTAVEAGMDEIPAGCRLQAELDRVIAWIREGLSAKQITARIHEAYDEALPYHRQHVIPNAMIIVMSLLLSGYHLGRALRLTARAGFDVCGNAVAVGSVIGMMTGASHIDLRWLRPFPSGFSTAVPGVGNLTVDMLTGTAIEYLGRFQQAKPLLKK